MTAARLTPEQKRRIERLQRVANLMDDAFHVPGTQWRIGLDPIVGVLPVAGDGLSALAALWLVYQGRRMGAPTPTQLHMLWNVGLDFVVGSVPLLGDVIDAGMKVNRKNVGILERAMKRQGPTPDKR